ncbi:hypothetical protein DWV06_13010 [Anaerosacchariphilus polymeriproducens]|uniref:Uncharacterized protein n=1 Tax=Anaerosacchariphilus polymeriproducens TaxID=1812858 RepID=A0A371ASY7_9FIRM|nr:hypothetical protein DWV06_13010 [Anaerosacchariphilus polymeriproducens]
MYPNRKNASSIWYVKRNGTYTIEMLGELCCIFMKNFVYVFLKFVKIALCTKWKKMKKKLNKIC